MIQCLREKKNQPQTLFPKEVNFTYLKKKKSGGASPIFIKFITEKFVWWDVLKKKKREKHSTS